MKPCLLIRSIPQGCAAGVVMLICVTGSEALAASNRGRSFATPESAVTALAEAVQTTNRMELREIFGSSADDLVNPDPVQAANEFASFSAALSQTNYLLRQSDTRCLLEIGAQSFPFAVPLVQQGGAWFFDTAAGREELRNRRIGRNELSVLQTMRAFVAAEREYASHERDNTGVLKFAQKLRSSPGKKDGLYWPPDLDGEISPIGPLVAQAQQEGYGRNLANPEAPRQPYHGYYFKLLTRQGRHAPGGKYNYIINGNLIGGFALVAWPCQYGETGVMTFIVNQQGRVFQKDLGPKTDALAPKMKAYDPDLTWQLSRD